MTAPTRVPWFQDPDHWLVSHSTASLHPPPRALPNCPPSVIIAAFLYVSIHYQPWLANTKRPSHPFLSLLFQKRLAPKIRCDSDFPSTQWCHPFGTNSVTFSSLAAGSRVKKYPPTSRIWVISVGSTERGNNASLLKRLPLLGSMMTIFSPLRQHNSIKRTPQSSWRTKFIMQNEFPWSKGTKCSNVNTRIKIR